MENLHEKGTVNSILDYWFDVADFTGFVDGSWNRNDKTHKAGMGGFLLDRNRKVRFIFSGPIHSNSAFDTELEALHHLLKAFRVSPLGSLKLTVLMDSLSIVQHFKKYRLNCLQFTNHWVHNVLVSHIRRNNNSTADTLAKEGSARDKFFQSLF